MRLVVSPLAVQRLGEIADYVAEHNPNAAGRVEAAIRKTFELLCAHPLAGRSVGSNLRRFVVPRLPYVILYRADEAKRELTIATIRHTAQRPI